MRMWRFGCALTFAFAVGCGSSEPPAKANGSGNSAASVGSAAKTNVVEKTDSEGKPQPKLRTIKLWMGPEDNADRRGACPAPDKRQIHQDAFVEAMEAGAGGVAFGRVRGGEFVGRDGGARVFGGALEG